MDAAMLERLASDRPQRTRELHLPSAFYGHADALRRYAGLPRRKRLKVAIEHGVGLTPSVWDVDLEAAVPTFVCASPERAARYTELASADRVAVAIGPMILYAPRSEPDAATRRLVAFPAHSTHHVDAVYDVDRFARRLERRRGDWDEIEVCVYWRDILRGVHHAYLERGFRCVTAGHMYDPAFLTRLRAILERATVVTSNEIGSYLFYAVALDRPVWVEPDEVDYVADPAVLDRDRATAPEWGALSTRLRELFVPERDAVGDEQRATVDALAGLRFHRSPADVGQLLAAAEARYRAWASPPRRAAAVVRAEGLRALAGVRTLRGGR